MEETIEREKSFNMLGAPEVLMLNQQVRGISKEKIYFMKIVFSFDFEYMTKGPY